MLGLFVSFVVLSLIVHAPTMSRLDQRITKAIQRYHGPWLDRLARAATFLGNTEVLIGIGLTVAGFLVAMSRPWAALLSASSLLGMPISGGIKHLVRRPRPESAIARVVLPAIGLSFPSGHAMTALMFYGFIALLVAIHAPGVQGLLGISALGLLILSISMSRIYLGAHWFSDVIGGWVGGSFFLLLSSALYRTLATDELLTG
jgi:undecaprenyl-diphosphatase